MKSIKLHWKLTAFFCLAILMGLLIGFFYLSVHVKEHLGSNLKNTLVRDLALGKSFIGGRLKGLGDIRVADALADQIGKDLGLRATIVAQDGKVLGDSELDAAALMTVENHANRPEIISALEKGFGLSRRYSYTVNKYLLYAAAPLGEGNAGVLRLAIPLSDVELFERRFLKVVLFSLMIVFVLSFGFTFLIAVWVSRPLREMADVARGIARGDFSRQPRLGARDELGDLARAIAYMSDEIKFMLERIRKEGNRLDAVLAGMSEGVMVVAEKGDIVLMNPSLRKILFINTSPEGKKLAEIIRNTAVLDIVQQLLSGQDRIISKEITMLAASEQIFKVNAVAITKDHGLEGAVLVFHDITELRRLEKVRQDFVANVSHELRTPVASIKGYAETLLSGALEDRSAAHEFVGVIHDNSNRLIGLINDLLDLAKIESEKMSMVFMPLELKPMIGRCLGVLERMIDKKSLNVTQDLPEFMPKLKADEARLSQVLLNLLDNAVKYTPDQGHIKIRACVQGEFLRIDIEDSGIGIPKNDLPRIFERFYRVDSSRSYELGGTGLGLSIVKHIVQAHGGDVVVVSDIGRGSIFSVTIPTV